MRKGLCNGSFFVLASQIAKGDCIKIFNIVKFTKERMKSEEYNCFLV